MSFEADNDVLGNNIACPMQTAHDVPALDMQKPATLDVTQQCSMDVLAEVCYIGITPDVPALDTQKPATQIVVYHDNRSNQTISHVDCAVCYP